MLKFDIPMLSIMGRKWSLPKLTIPKYISSNALHDSKNAVFLCKCGTGSFDSLTYDGNSFSSLSQSIQLISSSMHLGQCNNTWTRILLLLLLLLLLRFFDIDNNCSNDSVTDIIVRSYPKYVYQTFVMTCTISFDFWTIVALDFFNNPCNIPSCTNCSL